MAMPSVAGWVRALRRPRWFGLAVALLLGCIPAGLAGAQTPGAGTASGCSQPTLPHGALGMICVPAAWNGELVIWAHGYVDVTKPLGFYQLTLSDGTDLPTLAQSAGFAFATTSYRQNGLAILEGMEDIQELTLAFRQRVRVPTHTYLLGGSEGGLVTTLLMERSPELFSGAVAACGPIGDFRLELNYIGDFRVLFDYFLPGVIPGSPILIPADVMASWDTTYVPRIIFALLANPQAALELMATAKAAYDPADLTTVGVTTLDLLWYNVFGTNDARAKLGGNPYGNRARVYSGSSNDLALNASVRRFTAEDAALANLSRTERAAC